MPDFQCTLFMESNQADWGWTESYFRESADIDAGLTFTAALATARSQVLADRYFISAGRVSDVTVTRDSLLISNVPITGVLAAPDPGDVCEPWTAFNVRMEAGSRYRGRKFFHGILETTFNVDRAYDPANPDHVAWTTWFNYILANCNLRHKTGGVFLYSAITNIVPRFQTKRAVGRPFNLLVGRRRIHR